ncbi:MAG: hypothetical protein KJ018_17225 [Burkholderiales bacterium]|nr:hypothetical protein [Burkholderiales bacterium]
MRLHNVHRRLAAWLVAFCMLFAQSAAIAYACPRDAAEPVAPCAAHLDGGEAGVTPAGALPDGNVCEVHCHPVFLPDTGVDVPSPPGIVAWRLPPPTLAAAAAVLATDVEARSASPPLRTLYARLLI